MCGVRRGKVEKLLEECGFVKVASFMYEKDGYRVLTEYDPFYVVYTPEGVIVPISLPNNVSSKCVFNRLMKAINKFLGG